MESGPNGVLIVPLTGAATVVAAPASIASPLVPLVEVVVVVVQSCMKPAGRTHTLRQPALPGHCRRPVEAPNTNLAKEANLWRGGRGDI